MLSIDIGSKKVCVIQGSYRSGGVVVNSCSEIEYEGEVVANGVITDRPALSFMINEIIKTNKMKSKAAIVTINSNDIIARDFTLPNIKPADLRLLVINEMMRILGDDDSYIIDYTISGEPKNKNNKMVGVTAYAVRKEIVESYYTLIKELKLTPYAFDLHPNSMAKLLTGASVNGKKYSEENFIVVDIGFSKIAFHGFSLGVSSFNRTEVSLVQEFVREIGSIYRVDVTKEHLSKLDFSPDYEYENTIISDTCKYFIYRLSEEIQKYIQYMLLNSEVKSVSKVFICGGIALTKRMDEALTNSIKIPVEILNSVDRVTMPQGCQLSKICNAAGALIRI
jgi:type IV pilus assembly protein PilM